jgi:serine/threonine protein kinase
MTSRRGESPFVETMETLAGGRYELGPVLGRGGMAVVRRATDTVLGREVAVKLFREDLDDSDAARVRTEMSTLASLTHPHLVSVHDAGTEPDGDGLGQPYLVMELVEGPTLAACCLDGSLSADRVARLGAELGLALAFVHGRGVVHRDVKPANILLSPSGAKLADFGIARIVDGARHTSTGLTIGTAPYLSPEQVQGGAVGPAADVYALGLVLLECLTGKREYTGGPVEVALARLHRSPEVPATLPAPFPALLAAMTSMDAADRPTAQEVARQLGSEPVDVPDATEALRTGEPDRTTVLRPSEPDRTTVLRTGEPDRTTVLRTEPSSESTGGQRIPRVVRAGGPDVVEPARRPSPRVLIGAAAGIVVLVAAVALAAGSGGGSGASPSPRPSAVATAPAGTTPLQRHLTQLDQAVHP